MPVSDSSGSLNIELVEATGIRITRDDNVSQSKWNEITIWWGGKRSTDDRSFTISFDLFLRKKEWLKKWVRESGSVKVSDDVRSAIQNVSAELAHFEQIIADAIPIQDLNLPDLKLNRELRDFQIEAVKRLISIPSGANFSVPGAGKTTVTLVVWKYLQTKGTVNRLLVVCPRSAFEAWLSEPSLVFEESIQVRTYSGDSIDTEAEILIINYEQLERERKLKRIQRWVEQYESAVVFDEAHRVKGGVNSIRWRACREVIPFAKRVDILTGTPMPQSFNDLRNLMGLTWRNVPSTRLSDEYLASIPRGTIFVRTTKAELGLPPEKIEFVPLDMGARQAEIYSALARAYAGRFVLSDTEDSYFRSKGRAVMTLLAAATNPGLLMGLAKEDAYLNFEWPPRDISLMNSLLDTVENYSKFEIPAKYEWIVRFCKKASEEGRKILIWSSLVGNLKALESSLRPFNPALVYGALSQEERDAQIRRFREDDSCTALLTNPQTLGEGISLHQHCHEAIYVDRSYNAGQYLQSRDRIHRLGLPPTQITKSFILQSRNSIDFLVGPRLDQKINRMFDALNDESLSRLSLPDDGTPAPELLGIDKYDLDDLFSHLTSYGR